MEEQFKATCCCSLVNVNDKIVLNFVFCSFCQVKNKMDEIKNICDYKRLCLKEVFTVIINHIILKKLVFMKRVSIMNNI